MTNLTAVSSYDDVYQFETTDIIQGGAGGIDNQPHQSLLNRTQWLHDNKIAKSGDVTTGNLAINGPSIPSVALTASTDATTGEIRILGNTETTTYGSFYKNKTTGEVRITQADAGSLGLTFYTGTSPTQKMCVLPSGSVGIGTNSPTSLLDVSGSSTVLTVHSSTNTSQIHFYDLTNNVFIGTNTGNLNFGAGSTEYMRLTSSGKFLIGGTSAVTSDNLQIYGSTYATGTITSSAGGSFVTNNDGGYLSFNNNTGTVRTGYLQFNSAGVINLKAENSTAIVLSNTSYNVTLGSNYFDVSTPNFTFLGNPVATQAYVLGLGYAPLASPALTGSPLKNGSLLQALSDFASHSLAASGYQVLPGGLILQWAPGQDAGSAITNTFPIAFPNNCFIVVANHNGTTINEAINIFNKTRTNFQAHNNNGITANNYYFALGN